MQNVILGTVCILLGACLYFMAWKGYQRERYNWALACITLSGLVFLMYTASDFYLHVWDERYHALVAKNLMKHPLVPTLYDNPVLPYNYKMWISNHIWVHKQPLPLWLMAGSMKVFGVNEIALRLPSVLMATLGIVLTYKVAKYFYSKKAALLAAFLFSINGFIIELAAGRVATDHVDITFMFCILLAIYGTTRFLTKPRLWYTLLIGVCVGGALLTKWLTGLIVLPIWVLLVWHSQNLSLKKIVGHFLLLVFTIALVALPWQWYILKAFPVEATYESTYNLRHFTEVLEGRSGSVFYFLNQWRINYGELIYLPLVWLVWVWYKNPQDLRKMALLIWIMVPVFIFSLAKTKMPGYLLFTAPALFAVTGAFFYHLKGQKQAFPTYKWLINLVLALFLILPIRYGLERMKPFSVRERNPQWVTDLRKLGDRSIKHGLLFNYKNPIEAMFYTNLTVYPQLPANEKLRNLQAQGYQILVNQGAAHKQLKSLRGVEFVQLTASNRAY